LRSVRGGRKVPRKQRQLHFLSGSMRMTQAALQAGVWRFVERVPVWMAKAAGLTICSLNGSGALIKYEEVFLHARASVAAKQVESSRYLTLHNARCRHSSLTSCTPNWANFPTLRSLLRVAA
jgi:hypothetical protein